MNFPSLRGWVVLAVGLVVLAVGGVRLVGEIDAALAVDHIENGFRNGDGFAAQVRQQALRDAVTSGDAAQMRERAIAYLKSAPFDPVVMSVAAHARMTEGDDTGDLDLRALSARFDQAVQIAPKNQLVRALRDDAQQRLLRRSQPTKAPAAK